MISKRGNQGQGSRKRVCGNRNNSLSSGVSNCSLVSEEIWPLFAKRIANKNHTKLIVVRLVEVIL